MVKKQNSNVWLVYLIALIAIVALILGAVAVYKANMTGQGIFDFWKKQEVSVTTDMGLLGNGEDISQLESYEVMFKDGEMVYETINGEMNIVKPFTRSYSEVSEETGELEEVVLQFISDDIGGGNYKCKKKCRGAGCHPQAGSKCDPDGEGGCTADTWICTGGSNCADKKVCKKDTFWDFK